jgi:hypothetical protein
MTINRKKVYPIMFVFIVVSTIVRVLLFPEFGLTLYVIAFFSSLVAIPLLFEGTLAVHNYFNRFFSTQTRPFHPTYRLAQRIATQLGLGILAYFALAGIGIWFWQGFIPAVIKPLLFSRPFFVAGSFSLITVVLSINLALFGKEFFDNWKAEILRNERLQKERAEVQFDNLKNQFNPHFLFNSLASLNSLIFENPQLASDFLQQLSKVYRYVLQANNDLVSVETELAFVKRYAHLLETRFQEGLKVEFEVSEEALEKKIVPVTLQILMENAVKHNIASAQKPLHIRVFDSNGFLSVANNVQRKTIVEESNKQGLQRLVQLYSYLSEHPILIAEVNGVFCVKIPLLS